MIIWHICHSIPWTRSLTSDHLQTFGMTLEETSQVFGDGVLASDHPNSASAKGMAESQPGATHVDDSVDGTQEKSTGIGGN